MVPDKVIFFLQVVAASLMAADYFFDETERKPINTVIQKKASELQGRITEEGRKFYKDVFLNNLGRTLAGVLFLVSTSATLFLLKTLSAILPVWGVVILTLGFLLVFAAAIHSLLDKLVPAVALLCLGIPLWSFSWFVKYCKKGSIFGIGFLFLVASFVCRYLNLQ